MNWTESTLNRHSRRRGFDPDTARQKEYFAKSRACQQQDSRSRRESTSEAPFIPSYIPQASPSPRQTLDRSRESRGSMIFNRRKLVPLSSEASEGEADTPALGTQQSLGYPQTEQDQHPPSHPGRYDLTTKRRKLLGQEDWTGLELQRPLVLDYEPAAIQPDQMHIQYKDLKRTAKAPSARYHRGLLGRNREESEHDHESIRLHIGDKSLR
ncbi:uncharacterized protein F5Z01DRAFT_556404 [Emericellopsis atlantica]|uniref:Uncharacterized protein n=1 Tax=Emericellopsis atlantica TaxID=2614577 RepID=A0A9P7ZP78_9HYPO|nr:uncharacterized protein F5Z01DRAFT_556404 [Emericellopsis atlantica]KAG9255744.1 hypothetical protein F5Z01DRAFT_556404 [Emericellopsis atlantica]